MLLTINMDAFGRGRELIKKGGKEFHEKEGTDLKGVRPELQYAAEALYQLGEDLREICSGSGHRPSVVTNLGKEWPLKTLKENISAPDDFIDMFVHSIEQLQWYKESEMEEIQTYMISNGYVDSAGYELLLNEIRRRRGALGYLSWNSPGEKWGREHRKQKL